MAKGTTVNRNGRDAYVVAEHPSRNYAGRRRLWLESGTRYAYLWFNRPFPLGATIVNATLRVYTSDAWNIAPTLTAQAINDRWRVNRLTWNNKPPVRGAGYPTTKSSAADGDEWAFDVTEMMQHISDGGDWWGLRISTDAAAGRALYSSDAHGAVQPELEVTWSEAPQPPTTLAPSGGRAVSRSHPWLRFDFTDHMGSTALQAVQVQVDPNGSWATPAFDSGTVLATEPELDLDATAYPGLPAGTETRWRVRVQDASGLWSGWSDVARFRRDVKGNLTIDNPAAAPNDFVSEWTPPIIWTLAGETQKAWQVFVTPADDRTNRLHDTGRTRGSDTSWTLPRAVLEDDSRYRVVVRVWDSKDREHTPGDPVFTAVDREFDFREDPTTNPVTNLTAVNLLPRPWVQLEWQRTTAPDYFVVKRDGRVVETELDPDDLLVPGTTTYRWTDKDARPWRDQTWVVQAAAFGDTSGNNPSVSLRPESYGVWLADRERNIDVLIIAGKDPAADLTFGEDATNHYPLGSRRAVRVTQGMRGWEGTVSGRLIDRGGFTANQWQQRLLELKERPGDDLTLTIGHEAFRVQAFNINTTPLGNLPGTKTASFEFFQIGRLPFRARL